MRKSYVGVWVFLAFAVSIAALVARPTAASSEDPLETRDVEASQNRREAFGFDANPERVEALLATDEGRKYLDLYGAALTDEEAAELGRRQDAMQYVRVIEASLRERDDFGLVYLDHVAGGLIVVGITEVSTLNEAQLREIGGVPRNVEMTVKTVPSSFKELHAAYEYVMNNWAAVQAAAGANLDRLGGNERNGTLEGVVVGAADPDAVSARVAAFLADAGHHVPVLLESGSSLQPLSSVVGGTRINSAAPNGCSSGLQVYADTIYGRMN